MPVERKKILKPYLILCEGRDAEGFLINYLNSEVLAQDKRFSNDIQIFDFGGNDDICNFLMNLKNMDSFGMVTSIAIIRDAEKDYAKACNEVSRALRKSGFVSVEKSGTWVCDDMGLRVGFILFPLNNDTGTLEDLCLRILSEKSSENILSSINEFLADMETTHGRTYRRKQKNMLHTYLSSSDEYVTKPLGLASSAGAFDWESDELIPLKRFLIEGFSS